MIAIDYETRTALRIRYETETPAVGTPCTYSIGSDRYAYQVTKVLARNKVEIRRVDDRTGKVPAIVDADDVRTEVAIRNRSGQWNLVGKAYCHVHMGIAETRLDPGF